MSLATSFFSNYGAAGPRQVELNYRLHHYYGTLCEFVTISFIMYEINETFCNLPSYDFAPLREEEGEAIKVEGYWKNP